MNTDFSMRFRSRYALRGPNYPGLCLESGDCLSNGNFTFAPGNIPVAAELAAVLGKDLHYFEAETLVQRGTCGIRQGVSGDEAVDVFVLESAKQRLIELPANSLSGSVGRAVD